MIKDHVQVRSRSKKGLLQKLSYWSQGPFLIIKDYGSNFFDVRKYDDANSVLEKGPIVIYFCQKFIYMKILTQQKNDTMIMHSIQWYQFSRIAYSLTCTKIYILDHNTKFLEYWMILPATVSTVRTLNLTMAFLLLNIYSKIRVLIWQVLIKPLRSNQTLITVTS